MKDKVIKKNLEKHIVRFLNNLYKVLLKCKWAFIERTYFVVCISKYFLQVVLVVDQPGALTCSVVMESQVQAECKMMLRCIRRLYT